MSQPTSPPPAISAGLKIRIAVTALAVAALVAAAVLILRPPHGQASLIGGPFRLQGPDGRIVSDAEMKGHPFLVFFGYTHCPDICPTTLAQLTEVLRRLPDKPIPVLFITIDPERDTPEFLKDYLASFDPRIVGLSGGAEAIGAAEKAYRVYAKKEPQPNGDYGMAHSSIVYLMDAQGGFIEAFNLERAPEAAAKELAGYL